MYFGKHISKIAVSSLMAIWSICTAFLLTGCTGTSIIYSNALVKPAEPVKEIKVLYLENTLTNSSGMSGWILEAVGYENLPERLRERVPVIFGMNNIVSDYSTSKRTDFGPKETPENIKWTKTSNAQLMVIQIVNGWSSYRYGGLTHISLNLQATLFDTATYAKLWIGQFENTLKLEHSCQNTLSNNFVDQMLKTILEQMAQDRIIMLPGNNAMVPTPQPPLGSNALPECKYTVLPH